MKEKALYNVSINKESTISISKGNTKIGKGIYTINLLPGEELLKTETKGLLTDIPGTCQGCCDGCEHFCYAVRDTKLHHNVCITSQGKNTLIMRDNLQNYFKQIKEYIEKHTDCKLFRYHSSGEIESYDYLLEMVELAKQFPNIHFYFYTKRFNFIDKYIKENEKFPVNLVCNLSTWKDNAKGYEHLSGLNQFVWDDGNDPEIAKLHHCPAVSAPKTPGGKGHETGITCDKCKRCIMKNDGHITAVYNH